MEVFISSPYCDHVTNACFEWKVEQLIEGQIFRIFLLELENLVPHQYKNRAGRDSHVGQATIDLPRDIKKKLDSLKGMVKKRWVEDIKKYGRMLQEFKLKEWIKVLDMNGGDWCDDTMRISLKKGPRKNLISLIMTKDDKQGEEVECHRVQMGQAIYNKLKQRYLSLGHDEKRLHSRMMVMMTIYDTLLVNSLTYGMQGTILPGAL